MTLANAHESLLRTLVMSTPMRRTRSACCARATTGHAAELPSLAMNSRRRIGHPPGRSIGSLSRPGMKGNGLLPAATDSLAPLRHGRERSSTRGQM